MYNYIYLFTCRYSSSKCMYTGERPIRGLRAERRSDFFGSNHAAEKSFDTLCCPDITGRAWERAAGPIKTRCPISHSNATSNTRQITNVTDQCAVRVHKCACTHTYSRTHTWTHTCTHHSHRSAIIKTAATDHHEQQHEQTFGQARDANTN